MSLRCPQCGTTVPGAKVLWFVRLFSFTCQACDAKLALTNGARTILVASIVTSVVVSYVIKTSMESETPAIVVLFVGVLVGCVLTWRLGELGIVGGSAVDDAK